MPTETDAAPPSQALLRQDTTLGTPSAAIAGLLAAGTALGAGELAAGIVRTWASPLESVAEKFIELTPVSLERWAIERFGTNDKLVLVSGAIVAVALLGVVLGVISRRRPLIADAGIVLLGVIGILANVTGVGGAVGAIPSLIAIPVGLFAIRLLTGRMRVGPLGAPQSAVAGIADTPRQPSPTDAPQGPVTDRRWFLRTAGAVTVVAATSVAAGRWLSDRFSAAASRAAVILPGIRSPLAEAPSGVSLDVDGISPYYTPMDEFYRIDTALSVPQVSTEAFSLRIHGLVDREVTFSYDDLLAMDLVERDITLTCVSNVVGGGLLGHARWTGVLLRDLLDKAGIRPEADQIVGRSVDDWTAGFPVEAAYDRDALVVIGMYGEPLPIDRGFPARLIVPGLYGYVSATKWLQDIEVTRFDAFDQYWVERGWDALAPILPQSRIDTPKAATPMAPGPTMIGGMAWAQNSAGISKVEVRIDGEDWIEAELGEAFNTTSWRQWRTPWVATEGNHRISVRATDGEGNLQTEDRREPFPNSATGWHGLFVQVRG